ncbi:MAG: hypothetical protein JJE36_01390 [Coriobacteriia bacterium]|nr:hypothetical protein [Coriobacteriia bacterium]
MTDSVSWADATILGVNAAMFTSVASGLALLLLTLALFWLMLGHRNKQSMHIHKVIKPKLIAVYFGINAVGIMAIGYLFNAVLH